MTTQYNTYIITINNTQIRWAAKSARDALQSVIRSKNCPEICPSSDDAVFISVKLIA